MKIYRIVLTIFIFLKRIFMTNLRKVASLCIISLLMFHLLITPDQFISPCQASIAYDNPSQDDDKSSQEKKK